MSKWALDFDCGSMALAPGLDPSLCPNYQTCKQALGYDPDAEFELFESRGATLTRRTAASSMLMRRGCPQTPQSLGVTDLIANLTEQIAQLESRIESQFPPDCYIAPPGSSIHFYQVARGDKRYTYYKLCAKKAVFTPVRESCAVKNIHLSKWNDSRCQKGLDGVGRRNQLTHALEQLKTAKTALNEALQLLSQPTSSYWEESLVGESHQQTLDEAIPPN